MNVTEIIIKMVEPSETDYVDIFDWLLNAGLRLENPASGLITYISSDMSELEPVRTDAESVRKALLKREPGSVHVWFHDGGGPGIYWDDDRFYLSLDGLADHARKIVLHALVDNIAARANRTKCSGWSLELNID